MASQDNKYKRDEHEDYVVCPRTSCQSRNAPPESDDFEPNCWNCGEYLNIQPIDTGEEFIVDITDMHESGAGVGHTDDGFVVLVDGVLPEKQALVRIDSVYESHADGELIEVIAESVPNDDETPTDEDGEDDDEDKEEDLGARGDWWG